ncbi:MAG: glutathione S-transferase family protein [Pseudomonadota bacterium]
MTQQQTLLLWQYFISPFSDKVRRALHYKGLDYNVREVKITETGKLKSVSPTGKFPVLETEGRFIVDSTDILDHLDALVPERLLTPADPREAALAAIFEDWADESLYFYDLTMRSWPANIDWLLDDLFIFEKKGWKQSLLRRLIPSALPKQTRAQGLGRKAPEKLTAELKALFEGIDALVADGGWLVSSEISRADLSVRAMTYVINRAVEGRAVFDALPNLRAWEAKVDALTLPEPANNDRFEHQGSDA